MKKLMILILLTFPCFVFSASYYKFTDVDGDEFLVCHDRDGWIVTYIEGDQIWTYGNGYNLNNVINAHKLRRPSLNSWITRGDC